MYPLNLSSTLRTACAVVVVAVAAVPVAAQFGGGPAPVRFTPAIEAEVRSTIDLTGTVESRRSSVVASEVAGLVVELAVREGDRVEKGDPLVVLRRQSLELRLEAADGDVAEAEARLALARASLTRARKLVEDQVFSEQQLDDAVSEADAWTARVARLTAERDRLADDLDRSTVRSPFDGVVVEERCAEGEWISAGGAVMEVMDFIELEVTVEVPERQFVGLVVGAEAEVTFGALPGSVVEGRIRAVVPRANPQSRTFPVKVAVDNSNGRIGVGMLARVALPIGEPSSSVMVPKDAIVSSRGGEIVYVIGDDESVVPVPVETGASSGPWVSVNGEIRAGDRVVTRGNERLRPGMTVLPSLVDYEQP